MVLTKHAKNPCTNVINLKMSKNNIISQSLSKALPGSRAFFNSKNNLCFQKSSIGVAYSCILQKLANILQNISKDIYFIENNRDTE